MNSKYYDRLTNIINKVGAVDPLYTLAMEYVPDDILGQFLDDTEENYCLKGMGKMRKRRIAKTEADVPYDNETHRYLTGGDTHVKVYQFKIEYLDCPSSFQRDLWGFFGSSVFRFYDEHPEERFRDILSLDMYDLRWEGDLNIHESPEAAYSVLQGDRPLETAQTMHSLTVGDVIDLNGKLWFCDQFGFTPFDDVVQMSIDNANKSTRKNRKIKKYDASMLDEAYDGSYYTITGAGGNLDEWKNGYQDMLNEEGIGQITKWIEFTGKDMNEYYELSGNVAYPEDLHFLAFCLDGLDTGKLAMFKLQMGDRWFDDIVNNNRDHMGKSKKMKKSVASELKSMVGEHYDSFTMEIDSKEYEFAGEHTYNGGASMTSYSVSHAYYLVFADGVKVCEIDEDMSGEEMLSLIQGSNKSTRKMKKAEWVYSESEGAYIATINGHECRVEWDGGPGYTAIYDDWDDKWAKDFDNEDDAKKWLREVAMNTGIRFNDNGDAEDGVYLASARKSTRKSFKSIYDKQRGKRGKVIF